MRGGWDRRRLLATCAVGYCLLIGLFSRAGRRHGLTSRTPAARCPSVAMRLLRLRVIAIIIYMEMHSTLSSARQIAAASPVRPASTRSREFSPSLRDYILTRELSDLLCRRRLLTADRRTDGRTLRILDVIHTWQLQEDTVHITAGHSQLYVLVIYYAKLHFTSSFEQFTATSSEASGNTTHRPTCKTL